MSAGEASRVTVPGSDLAVFVDGPAEGEVLLLFNGARTCSALWDPVLEHVPGFRTVRFDMRGHGRSTPSADPALYSIERYADDAGAVLDAIGVDDATVWGVAFGARVALAFADRHPGRVRRLALFDASVDRADPDAQAAGQRRAAAARRAAGVPETPGRDRWFVHDDPGAAADAIRHVARNSEPQPPRLKRLAQRPDLPVLLAVGDHDPNEPATRRMSDALPAARFALLPLTGHGSVVERPDLCAEVFLDWAAASM